MNQYTFWNPRGTSNSQYGNFNFYSSLPRAGLAVPSQSASNFNLAQGANGAWDNHQHLPGCHNYYAQNNSEHHQHNPGCPNNPNQMGQWMQGQQSLNLNQDQMGQGEGTDASNGTTPQFQQQDYVAPMADKPKNEIPFDHKTSVHQPDVSTEVETQSQPGGDNKVVGGENPPEEGHGDVGGGAQQASPEVSAAEVPKPKSVAWRGIPRSGKNAVTYGRHVQPSYARQYQTQLEKMSQMPQLPPNMNIDKNQGGNSSWGHLNMAGEHVPADPAFTSAAVMPSKRELIKQKTQSVARLCGKCSKCKNLVPVTQGPSTMAFPTHSTQSQRGLKPNVRSMHSLGQQDAKNFRAIRYT